MKRRSGLLLCLFALSCASAPEKKILKETDYQIWQKDLALRVSRESDNLQLRAELAEIALINEDFATALKTVRELMSKMPGDIRA